VWVEAAGHPSRKRGPDSWVGAADRTASAIAAHTLYRIMLADA
jgi:hypothetical protein